MTTNITESVTDILGFADTLGVTEFPQLEYYANNCSTTVGSTGYTAGSGLLNVASTTAPWPQITGHQQFHITIYRLIGGVNTVIVVLAVTGINSSTQFAVTAEGTDANAIFGDLVIGTLTTGGMNCIRGNVTQVGVYAGLPSIGHVGDRYSCTDCPFDLVWNGSSWTSLERCSLLSEGAKNYGTPYSNSIKAANWAGSGGVATLINYQGGQPGFVSEIFLAVNGGDSNLEAATIQVYIDGSGSPTINCLLTAFMAKVHAYDQAHGIPLQYYSRYLNSPASTAFYVRIPMPFTTGIEITITNVDATNYTIWSNIYCSLGVPNLWKGTRKLQVAVASLQTFTPYQVVSLLSLTNSTPGRLFGISMSIDGNGSTSPGFAWAEGPISMFIDGASTPQINSSGTEDYFGSVGYWGNLYGTTLTSDFVGALLSGTSGGGHVYGAYRLHILDPITWQNAITISWTAGIASVVSFTGNGVYFSTVWYYTQ